LKEIKGLMLCEKQL